jgi:hypothetical protein
MFYMPITGEHRDGGVKAVDLVRHFDSSMLFLLAANGLLSKSTFSSFARSASDYFL